MPLQISLWPGFFCLHYTNPLKRIKDKVVTSFYMPLLYRLYLKDLRGSVCVQVFVSMWVDKRTHTHAGGRGWKSSASNET